jgi:hypothetical protein
MPLVDVPEIARLQQLSSFSDLYIKLYDNGRFWVEILNWWGSDINIHDHDFSGIQFQLCGYSLNVDYAFAESEDRGDLRLGKVTVTGAKVWHPGDRSVVMPGRETPHNVCHLNLPTVSLLVRTHPARKFGPQWNYFPPGVAANYGIADAVFRKNVKALRLLTRGDLQQFRRAFRRYAACSKPEQLLFTLIKMIDIVFEPRFVELLHDLIESGDPVRESIVEAAAYHRAIEAIKVLRHRFELSWDERLALSVVGSSFDAESVGAISERLMAGEFDGDVMTYLSAVRNRSADDAQRTLDNTLKLFRLAA